jgi:hypothetical protein
MVRLTVVAAGTVLRLRYAGRDLTKSLYADSCSICNHANGTRYTDMEDYHRMWQGIQASGRPMILTVEGSPPADVITHGGYGNAKRVGHDISPSWQSMISLVDAGSGLWPFAHNSKDVQYGGWCESALRSLCLGTAAAAPLTPRCAQGTTSI